MQEFIEQLPQMLHLILAGEATEEVGTLCSCESGKRRTVQCHDCFLYETSCEDCFIR